ncbi:DUF6005 family protein [Exiguobacterium antarcticum]|uniref:DUF6005 family protein n=1 Tax=Exiguobacterium antarcticum TaxID=132920 RepID=A0ABT6R0B2_9BACL|nr:DUF6005 family protein [Exiguobacterium antarcticum]MDI3234283.1 DUF6005 family protein [Exiguobacterium antarcticum]
MIKVHCLVSCVCETIKRSEADHRPYYFGIWDADFAVTPDFILSHHDERIDHQAMLEWYRLLYGITVHRWYEPSRSKAENLARLDELMATKRPEQSIIVMLDLARLPERENKFHHDVFPHYVMLEPTADEETWQMLDPDFRYEGEFDRMRIIQAINQPTVSGGFWFDSSQVQLPDAETVSAYFMSGLKRHHPLTEAVQQIVLHHIETPDRLPAALKQLPVIAIRKYAYEHAFAYFYEHLAIDLVTSDFEDWCDQIERLVHQYTVIQHRAIKYSVTRDSAVLREIQDLLAAQTTSEDAIKRKLVDLFSQYRQKEGDTDATCTLYDQLPPSSTLI